MEAMDQKDVEDFVANFKGMLWDELEDYICDMSREDLQALIMGLKKRFGWYGSIKSFPYCLVYRGSEDEAGGACLAESNIFFYVTVTLNLKKIVGDGSNPGGDVFSIH